MFGLTNSVLHKFFLIVKVVIPFPEQIEVYKQNILAKFPDLDGVWCVKDRLKIPIQKLSDELMQNS